MIDYLPLKTVCHNIIDCPHETPEWKSKGIPVIRNFNLVDGQIDMSDGYYVDEQTFEKRTRRAVPSEGDIIFSREAPIGNCAIVPKGFKCCLGQRLVLLQVNHDICSSEYLLAVLQSSYVLQQIQQVSKRGSIVSNFAIGDLKDLMIPVIDNQNDVARISNTIATKISNNTSICTELEAMAKLLYDYWFVQFDFPDENGNPYKSSGGKMAWNDVLKREIPVGWEAGNITRIATILPGGTPSKAVDEYWINGTIPFFGPTDYQQTIFQFETADHITENGLNACASSRFDVGTVIITARGSIGKLVIVGTPMAMNQSCYAFSPYNNTNVPYLYFLTKQIIEYLKVKGTGSVFKSIVTDDILNSILPIGPAEEIDRFCQTAQPMFERIKKLEAENMQLTSLRDFLLPMLMNGQVKVVPDELYYYEKESEGEK